MSLNEYRLELEARKAESIRRFNESPKGLAMQAENERLAAYITKWNRFLGVK